MPRSAAGARALVLASPHNPTGRVLPRGELEAIAERCAEHEAWVLADEIHGALTLPGATYIPWLEVSDAARRWGIRVTSASKAFNLAALKTALVVTADPAARDFVERDALAARTRGAARRDRGRGGVRTTEMRGSTR